MGFADGSSSSLIAMTVSEPVVRPDRAADDGFRRLHPLSPVLTAAGQAPQTLLAVGFVLFTTGLGRVILAFGAILLVARALDYWRTTYCLTDERLVIRSGWFQRSERVVSPDRLQHIEVVRALRHRIGGVAEVRIALGGSTAVTLDSVTITEAARIRDTLERGRRLSAQTAAPADVPPPPSSSLLTLGLGQLALGAVTGAGLLLFPVVTFALVNQFGSTVTDRVDTDRVLQLGLPILVLGGIAACFVIAAGVMWIRYFGYTLARSGSDVSVEYGLLDRRSSVIPLRRVQRVDLRANIVRRWAGLRSLDVSRAQAVSSDGSGSVDDTVPVLSAAEADRLVAAFAGVEAVPDANITHPVAARRRAMIRRAAVLSPAWIAGLFFEWWGGVVGLGVALAVAWVWADRWYRRLRHAASTEVLVVEEGVVSWHRTVQPWAKVQSLSTRQTPTQRRAGLLDLVVHVAGGSATTRVRDITPEQMVVLLDFHPQLLATCPSVAEVGG